MKGGVVSVEKIDKKSEAYKKLEKNKQIKKEVKKLKDLYKDLEKDRKEFAESLIENAAFMIVSLDELAAEINVNGYTTEYKNGENQFGQKKSPAVETYNTMIKNYASIMKVLEDLLPPAVPEWAEEGKGKDKEPEDDGFEDFTAERADK